MFGAPVVTLPMMFNAQGQLIETFAGSSSKVVNTSRTGGEKVVASAPATYKALPQEDPYKNNYCISTGNSGNKWMLLDPSLNAATHYTRDTVRMEMPTDEDKKTRLSSCKAKCNDDASCHGFSWILHSQDIDKCDSKTDPLCDKVPLLTGTLIDDCVYVRSKFNDREVYTASDYGTKKTGKEKQIYEQAIKHPYYQKWQPDGKMPRGFYAHHRNFDANGINMNGCQPVAAANTTTKSTARVRKIGK